MQSGGIEAEVERLIEACIRAVNQPPREDEFPIASSPDQTVADPRVVNGWQALRGWTHLFHDSFEEARAAFTSVEPVEGDPFGLALGEALANHLTLSQTGAPFEEAMAILSDRVWERTFSSMI